MPLYLVKLNCCYLLVSAYWLIYLKLASAYPGPCCMMLGNISCCQATTFSLWTLFPKYDLHRMYYFHIRPYPKIQFQIHCYLFLWSDTFVDLGTNTDYYIYTSYMNDTTKWQNRLTSWICFQDTLQNVFNETERVDFWKFGHLAKFEIVPVKWQLKFAESNLKIKEAESPLMVKLSNVNTLRKF